MFPVLVVVATWSCSGLRKNRLLVKVESAGQHSVSLSTSQYTVGYIQMRWPEDHFQSHLDLKGWEKPVRILFLYGKMWKQEVTSEGYYQKRKREWWSDLVSSLLQITSNDGAGTCLSGADSILMPLSLPTYIVENLWCDSCDIAVF